MQSLRGPWLAAFHRRGGGAGMTLTVTKQVAIAWRERMVRARMSSVFAQYGRGSQGNSFFCSEPYKMNFVDSEGKSSWLRALDSWEAQEKSGAVNNKPR